MSTTPRIGRIMRVILVVLWARRHASTTTAQLAGAIAETETATRHALAKLHRVDLVWDNGNEAGRDWRITEKGLDELSALWGREDGRTAR